MLRRRQDRHRRAAADLDRALRALGVGTGAVAPAWRVRSDGGNSRLAGRRGSEPRRLGDRAGPRRGRADSPPPAQPAKPAQDYAGAGRLPGLRARIDDGLGRVRRRTGGPTARRHRTQCLQAGRAVALARGAHGRPRRARRVGRRRGRGSSGSSSATWLRAQRGWQPRPAAASRGAVSHRCRRAGRSRRRLHPKRFKTRHIARRSAVLRRRPCQHGEDRERSSARPRAVLGRRALRRSGTVGIAGTSARRARAARASRRIRPLSSSVTSTAADSS
jgi:hypothetical protein